MGPTYITYTELKKQQYYYFHPKESFVEKKNSLYIHISLKSINSVSLKLITYLNAQRGNADTKRLTELKESAVRDNMQLTINLYTISMISSYFVYNIKNVIIFITNLMCAYFFESFLMINVIQPKISFSINRLFFQK